MDGVGTLEELLGVVANVSKKYEAKKEASVVRNYVLAFSRKVMVYSEVVDVFVSSHPEYAALVWGTMKVFFLVSIFRAIPPVKTYL